jgi:hypothetical protein
MLSAKSSMLLDNESSICNFFLLISGNYQQGPAVNSLSGKGLKHQWLKELKHNLIVSQAETGSIAKKTVPVLLFTLFLYLFEVCMLTAPSFFALEDFLHHELFSRTDKVWEALKQLRPYMQDLAYPSPMHKTLGSGIPLAKPLIVYEGGLHDASDCTITWGNVVKGELKVIRNEKVLAGASVIMAGAVFLGQKIFIGQGVLIETGAMIKEPAILGDCTEVRQGAYLRGYCLTGKGCVIGHATEVKHSIFLNEAKAGHFAYLGDSILGNAVNLGAGTKCANLRFLPGPVQIKSPEGTLDTGLYKLGAILGDQVQSGCNAVTNPGTLLGPQSLLLPNTTAPSGYHPAKSILR